MNSLGISPLRSDIQSSSIAAVTWLPFATIWDLMRVRCAYCRGYVEKNEAVRIGIQSFCSRDHLNEYNRAIIDKQRKSKTQSDIPPAVRLEVVTRDQGRCRICQSAMFLHIHHIKYRSEGGDHDLGNLISLCEHHHSMVHTNKKKYQQMLFDILGETNGNG
jgi:5-methylcytosine-specific restriction endonuclease McrA